MKKHGLPEHARLAFKGELFEVWQWGQKMYDGSTEIFEAIKRDDSATIIATVGDQILIEDQEQPDWVGPRVCLPGGRCEKGEDALAAAKRELREETGYASDDWEKFSEQKPFGKIQWAEHVFIARNCMRRQEPHLDSGEKITARFLSFDELLEIAEDVSHFSPDLFGSLIRARYDKKSREELHRLIFGNRKTI